MNTRLKWPFAVYLALACTVSKSDEVSGTAKDVAFFERKIRPLLVERCYECHAGSLASAEAGLRLDSRQGTRAGGDRGPAIIPGQPDKSLLIHVISGENPELRMPPDGEPVSQETVNDFVAWIRAGAVDPRDTDHKTSASIDGELAEGRDLWAYRELAESRPPVVKTNWQRSPIDAFIWKRLETSELRPREDADASVLLRRLSFDLTGLPPTREQQASFQAAIDALGFERALRRQVDELISQPAFGERWGRHWLDVARYAESSGKEANITFPYAWRYRDYVIDSVSNDIPLDRFVTEQIAGDLLPAGDEHERTRLLIATGFLAIGPKNLDATDPLQFRADVIDEQIDAVTRVFLGSSVACARCHDHKFDPFSMDDYYALAGIFASTKSYFGTAVSPANRVGGDPLRLPTDVGTAVLHRSVGRKKVAALKAELAALQREREEKAASLTLRDVLRIFWRSGAIEGSLEKVDDAGRALPLAMGVTDADEIADAPLLFRGDVHRPGEPVPRGIPRVLRGDRPFGSSADRSGRHELSDWLVSPSNSLAWRVMTNRVWLRLMGAGLVESVDDFGATGTPPSHPELLDYLAAELIEHQFSLKWLVREVVLSRTYRQASSFDREAFLKDPENRLLWRMPKRRIEVEAMRDAMLVAAGDLDARRPAGSLVGKVIGDRPVSLVGLDKRLPTDLDGANYRSVYLPVMRDRLPDVFEVFDFAEPSLVTGQRESTNVATQSLYLMNSQFVNRCAERLFSRLQHLAEHPAKFATEAIQVCYSRDPSPQELERLVRFLQGSRSSDDRQSIDPSSSDVIHERCVLACQALLATAEFRIVD